MIPEPEYDPGFDQVDDTVIKLGLPDWLITIGKTSLWALLAFFLVYQFVLQRNGSIKDIEVEVRANQDYIKVLDKKMDFAALSMNRFAEKREARDEAMIQLLLRLCVQTSSIPSDKQACFGAADMRIP